ILCLFAAFPLLQSSASNSNAIASDAIRFHTSMASPFWTVNYNLANGQRGAATAVGGYGRGIGTMARGEAPFERRNRQARGCALRRKDYRRTQKTRHRCRQVRRYGGSRIRQGSGSRRTES